MVKALLEESSLSLMEQAGYEVKQRRGAVSFRAPGQERFTRLRSDTLGDGYGEADIRAVLSGSRQRPGQPRQKVSLAIDIQSRLQGKGPGYERWAKVFNLKQMAAALAYLQDNGLTDYEQLEQKATAATEHFHKLSDQIKSTEAALHTNMELKAATVQLLSAETRMYLTAVRTEETAETAAARNFTAQPLPTLR